MNKEKRYTDIDITSSEYVNIRYRMAHPSRRVFAFIIDWFILGLIAFGLFFLRQRYSFGIKYELLLDFFFFFIYPFFNLLTEYYCNGQTLGKMLLDIMVVNEECRPPSISQCFARWIVFPIDFMLIGMLMIDRDGQRIGDILGGCYVVRKSNDPKGVKDFDYEFRFASTDYKPKYAEAAEVTDEELSMIRDVLYGNQYGSYKRKLSVALMKKFGREYVSDVNKFMEQLLQDAMYYRNHK